MLTDGDSFAESRITVELAGLDASTLVVSRSVARDNSQQILYPRVIGLDRCRGRALCDAIIMNGAKIRSIPEISAQHADAQLTYEAAIGKIDGEQMVKLTAQGLTEKEAEDTILEGFLK